MASTSALFTGLSGLSANARNLDVVGNNIANVNTTGFKSSRLNFQTQFYRTFSAGSPPGDVSGGANPFQVGLGVKTSGTQRNFNNGTISPTGDPRDLAIEGDGFFVVRRGEDQLYTRAGNFRPDGQQYLSSPSGDRLRGFGVDDQFRVVPGQLVDLRIPLGSLTIAEPTTMVRFRGNLNADGDLPSRGPRIDLLGTQTDGLRAVAGAVPAPGAGNLLEAGTRLVDIEDPLLPASGTALFSAGQSIEVRGAERGNRTIPAQSLAVDAASTVQDLLDFLVEAMGISTGAGPNPDGSVPGAALDPATGIVSIVGNAGSVNDLAIESADLRILDASGNAVRQPFVPSLIAQGDGESVRTTLVAYDSLGTPVELDVAMVLESRGNAGTTWRYYVESMDDAGATPQLATGTLDFGTDGQLLTTAPVTVGVDRSGTGAASPLSINLFFAQGDDSVTALTSDGSELAATFRDGSPIGTLSGFGVGIDGTILGSFTNGLTRLLGQVALATFTNNDGLVDAGGNLFAIGANSGSPVVTPPNTLGAGRTIGGSLELANVDLGEEFIKMILSSTGYSASSRVIRTADELMQQLLVIGR